VGGPDQGLADPAASDPGFGVDAVDAAAAAAAGAYTRPLFSST
jgi:hypothetical protein